MQFITLHFDSSSALWNFSAYKYGLCVFRQVLPLPLMDVASQLSSSAFSTSDIGQQLSRASSAGDVQAFTPLLLSTVQLLQASANISTNATEAAVNNANLRLSLLQLVQDAANRSISTTDSYVQQAQLMSAIASAPAEINQQFRQVPSCLDVVLQKAICTRVILPQAV